MDRYPRKSGQHPKPQCRELAEAILAQQARSQERDLRLVADYSMPNVSAKVVRIVHSYIDFVNRVVWKKY